MAFILGNDDLAKTAAEKGIELVVQVKSDEEAIKKASMHTQRDLRNLLVRLRARMERRDT